MSADYQVVGEASDGLEAVQKAKELQPDLILLDIGLPKLNGMEVARQLRRLVPVAKILFFSQYSFPDVVQEALRSGALGYVHKPRILSELLPALEAVLVGKQFVSSNLDGWESEGSTAAHGPHRHEILVYSDETVLIESFTRFSATALRSGNPAVVIATKSHLDGLRQALKAEGLDVDGASQRGTFIELDEANSFSTIMVDGLPDPARFFESIGGLMEAAIKAASAEHPLIAFCGEALGLLWAEGKTDAVIQLEQLCNDLAKKYEIDMQCAYPSSSVPGNQGDYAFETLCAQHSAVLSQ
jgi:CheY-like chemotaxis protein